MQTIRSQLYSFFKVRFNSPAVLGKGIDVFIQIKPSAKLVLHNELMPIPKLSFKNVLHFEQI